jgi:hypothetical protein
MPGGVVMELTMSGVDKIVLRETLEKAISEIQSEMAYTEKLKMREDLEKRKEILKTILEQITA